MRFITALLAALLLCAPALGESGDFIFDEFPAPVADTSVRMDPIIEENTMFWEYRSAIRGARADEPDFAGHFVVIQVGCGTECVRGILYDVRTGELYEVESMAYGASYRVDSRALVTGSCNVESPPSWLRQRLYLWDEEEQRLMFGSEVEANKYIFFNQDEC